MRKPLTHREWNALRESLQQRMAQVFEVMTELRRRNALGGERGYPANSMGSIRSNQITDRTGTLAVATEDDDPVRDAQLHLEKALLRMDRDINGPLTQALSLPDMHKVKMKALGDYYAKRGKR